MKHAIKKYISFVPMLTVLVIILLLSIVPVSAQESDTQTNSSASADMTTQTKVDDDALHPLSDSSVSADEDGYNPSIREGGQTIDAGTVPEKQQQENTSTGDLDGDGYGDAAVLELDYLDDDSDDDGILDGTEAGTDAKPKAATLQAHELAHTVQQRAAAQDIIEGALRGVEIKFHDKDSDDDGLNDEAVQRPGDPIPDIDITVNAVDVRGWDPKTKEAILARLAEIDAVHTSNDFGIWMASRALDDEKIVNINSTPLQTEVRYQARLRLFGFLPLITEVSARAKLAGEIEVDYPWYAFLTTKNDHTVITKLVSDIHTKRIAIEEEGVPAVNEQPAPKR